MEISPNNSENTNYRFGLTTGSSLFDAATAMRTAAAAPAATTTQIHQFSDPLPVWRPACDWPDAVIDSPACNVVVFPSFVLTFTVPNEPATVNLPEVNSALTEESSKMRFIDVLGSNSKRPALPMLTTAEASSGVAIVVEEKTDRPLLAGSPFTYTTGASPFAVLPKTVSSAAVLPGPAKATMDVVVKSAQSTKAETAFRDKY